MRVALVQLDGDLGASASARRARVADLVRAQRGADLVLLPELWAHGAFAAERWPGTAEPVDGPTAAAMSAAARDLGGWLHAGSIVERAPDGQLYNTALLFGPDGALRASYRKIHRFGFTEGEAVVMSAGDEIVTADLDGTTAGLATCYDLRFPEQFRLLTDAGARLLLLVAAWPARRVAHWSLLARARAVESQLFLLGCATAGTQDGVPMGGRSVIVDPWGEVLAEAGDDETVLTADLDVSRVEKVRQSLPVLRDRRLGLPRPAHR
jgi:predicted amidohydrolase